jgi:hypothetical protein
MIPVDPGGWFNFFSFFSLKQLGVTGSQPINPLFAGRLPPFPSILFTFDIRCYRSWQIMGDLGHRECSLHHFTPPSAAVKAVWTPTTEQSRFSPIPISLPVHNPHRWFLSSSPIPTPAGHMLHLGRTADPLHSLPGRCEGNRGALPGRAPRGLMAMASIAGYNSP